MRPFRFLSAWFAIDLCFKFVAVPALAVTADSTSLPVFAAAVLSAPVTYGVLRRYPDLDVDTLWYTALIAIALAVAGHGVVSSTFGRTPAREVAIGVGAWWMAATIVRLWWADADTRLAEAS